MQPPPGWDGRISMIRIFRYLHSGELFGIGGRLFVDILALVMILMPLSGVILYIFPHLIKRRRRHGVSIAPVLASTTRQSRRRHRRIGIASVVFLAACTITGTLLRPPFMLLIIRSRITPWIGTSLHNAEPWHDRLRRLHYDADYDRFLLSTADGIFFYKSTMTSEPQRPHREPPVSVMGMKVLEQVGPGRYLVGSFSGLYYWLPDKDIIMNWITKSPPPSRKPRLPFGENMVSGYIRLENGDEYLFDYNYGAMPISHNRDFPAMPAVIADYPVSLWTLAHETHTGRIYRGFMGQGQLFWIAVSGLCTFIILLTGALWWWRTEPPEKRGGRG